jgi:hypothetical protein
VLGQGGLGKDGRYKMNAMQALHGLHNLQKHYEINKWPIIWSKEVAKCGFDLKNEEFIKFQLPYLQGGKQLGSVPHIF